MLERSKSFVLCVLYILKSIPAALVRLTVRADAASYSPELQGNQGPGPAAPAASRLLVNILL